MKIRSGEVRFDYLNKAFFFDAGDIQAEVGVLIVVETDFGLDTGILSQEIEERDFDEPELPLKKILRVAGQDDLEKIEALAPKETKSYEVCEEEIRKADLGMKLVNARYTLDGSKVTFCYTADGRVDFRELVKTLAARLKTRIELRQVGVRDEARLYGGMGPCGRPLCCARFLRDFQSVSIKMAKEQGLPLNPLKISGICGRLFCCLKYEYDTYLEIKEQLPKAGETITREGIKGRVVTINVLRHTVELESEEGGRVWVEMPAPEFAPLPRAAGCGKDAEGKEPCTCCGGEPASGESKPDDAPPPEAPASKGSDKPVS
ncbi:MAG TPA: stage 0 sporulation family protein [bacterium]|nr:stage 0 sporulation family protein [bacterium]